MDPEATLEAILSLSAEINEAKKASPVDAERISDLGESLDEAIENLREWLEKDGAIPKNWAKLIDADRSIVEAVSTWPFFVSKP